MKKSCCKSVSDLWNTYDFSKIIITGIVLGLVLAFLDYYDTPSQLISSIPDKVVWAMLGGRGNNSFRVVIGKSLF